MNTVFYLFNKSFKNINNLTIEELGEKIYDFFELCDNIKDSGDEIFKSNSIYEEQFFDNYALYEIMYKERGIALKPEHKRALLKLDHITKTSFNDVQMTEQLNETTESNLYGLLCFNRIETPDKIDSRLLISVQQDWYSFHRYYLYIFYISEESFFERCRKYFPELFFHERNRYALKTLSGGLELFSETIVSHLEKLNDEFRKYYNYQSIAQSIDKIIQAFCSANNIKGSLQGENHDQLYFEFYNTQTKTLEKICCDPHLKLRTPDRPGNTQRYENRIYFHQGKKGVQGGKILIGHIGEHL
ncbi:MAG: hypothetical protein HQK88_03015 [Nitrospirae bacterium]|nr:hypothetical protein [Nitrospirota bacterium]MBF0535741.1 hypothetical protein [Nitrospirota bacterium]MBF0615770.1 hypothetical protein [Nitrospirota bacterium]